MKKYRGRETETQWRGKRQHEPVVTADYKACAFLFSTWLCKEECDLIGRLEDLEGGLLCSFSWLCFWPDFYGDQSLHRSVPCSPYLQYRCISYASTYQSVDAWIDLFGRCFEINTQLWAQARELNAVSTWICLCFAHNVHRQT